MTRTIFAADRVITGTRDLTDAAVVIEADRIVDVVPAAEVTPDAHLDGWLIPGFVDIHVHGGAGAAFTSTDDARRAIAMHRAHGTTSMAGSLVSTRVTDLLQQVPQLHPLLHSDELVGVHFEGPFLSPDRAGAQNPHVLTAPATDDVQQLIALMAGHTALITMAPERADAVAAVHALADAGWVVALGHSEADFATAEAAAAAGARLVTHLFNAMPAPHHRRPGLVEFALLDPRMTVELILDGHHLSAQAVDLATRLCNDRWIAVTDAIAAAGMGDGRYELGGLAVDVDDGVALLVGTQTLAGSTLTMDRAFGRLLTEHGVAPLEAVRGTSTRAADVLGRSDIGRLEPAAFADLVHWHPDLGLRGVMRRGEWLPNTHD